MRRWIILSVIIFSIACLGQAIATPIVITEEPVEEPFVEPTGTPACQPSPTVTLEVRRIDPSSVWVHASGLQPGEIPRVIYSASAKGEGMYGDAGEFREGADEQGEFSLELSGLELDRIARHGISASSTRAASPVRAYSCRKVRWLSSTR